MARCKWCGKRIPNGEGVNGPFISFRHYCSNKCKEEGEARFGNDGGFFGRLFRLILKIIIAIIGLIIIGYFKSRQG